MGRLDAALIDISARHPVGVLCSPFIKAKDNMIRIEDSVVLVTGAAGGLGTVLIEALLRRGARKVYAGLHLLHEAPAAWADRVVPLQLDITDPQQVAQAAVLASDVTILVNNAGLNRNQPMLSGAEPGAAQAEMNVNYFGTLAMCRAFAPMLVERRGAVVNILSVLARVSLPMMGSLCASKAAGLRLTDALRAELKPHGVQVLAVLPGVIDTAMGAGFPGPKALAADVVAAMLDALENGESELYPDAMAQDVARRLDSERSAVHAQFAAFL